MAAILKPSTYADHAYGVPPNFYMRFCVSGRRASSLIANVALRAPRVTDAHVGGNTVLLDEVWCKPAHRGQGYVSSLLKMAQDHAIDAGWAIACKPVAHNGRYMIGEDTEEQRRLVAFYTARDFEGREGPYLICYPF